MGSTSIIDSEFIGREHELGFLQQALMSSKELVLCFYGLAGIGKTWLMRKIASRFGEANEGIACAICDLTITNSPDYLYLLSMIRTQLNDSCFESYDEAVKELQQKLAKLLSAQIIDTPNISIDISGTTFHGNVGDIVGVKYENLVISIPKSELERLQQNMQDKITHEFAKSLRLYSTSKPVIILIDGYEKIEDWAGGIQTPLAGWMENTFLTKFCNDAKNILFVIARREPLNWERRNREWRTHLQNHVLTQFNNEEIKAYLQKREIDPSERFFNHIRSFTHGHPQCLALVIDLLNELRKQKAADDLYSLFEEFEEDFDEKVVSEFLVERILNLLPASLSNIVTQLAIPNWFTADIIKEITGLSSNESLTILENLLRYSFIRHQHGRGYSYHDVVREYMRIRLHRRNKSEYIRVHKVMVEYFSSATITSTPLQKPDQYREEIIYHLFPVDEAAALSRFSEAFERYEELHQRDASEQLYAMVASLPFQSRSTRLWMRYYGTYIGKQRHNWAKVKDVCKGIVEDDDSDTPLLARAFSRLGRSHWFLDETEEAIASYRQSAETYKSLGDIDEYGWNLRNLAKICRKHGRHDEAIKNCGECRRIFEDSGDQYKIGWILKTLGEVYKQSAQYKEAIKVLEESLKIWDELEFEYGTVDTLGALADVQRFGGSLVAAKETYTRSLSLFRKHGDNHGVGWSLHGLGEIFRMQGRLAISDHYTEDSLQLFSELNYTFGRAWNERSKGELARMANNYKEAIKRFQEARRLFDICDDPQGRAWTTHSLGETLVALGRLSEAEGMLNLAKEQLLSINDEYMLGRYYRSIATLERKKGSYTRASEYVSLAKRIYEKQGNVYQSAICDLSLVRITDPALLSYQILHEVLESALETFTKEDDVYHTIRTLVFLEFSTDSKSEAGTFRGKAQELAVSFDLGWLLKERLP